MGKANSTVSAGGVRLADDFRDNLIIDRYDPLFQRMNAMKRSFMRSENSEDAVTWNVFRTLRQIDPIAWLPALFKLGLPSEVPRSSVGLSVLVWKTVPPPPSLVVDLDEGDSEIDVVLEAPGWVWFIEAKYRSDISERTTNRPLRDQLLRNIDVGSYYAGVRDFFFSFLVSNPRRSPKGVQALDRYKDLAEPRRLLSEHRPDGLQDLKAVSLLSLQDLGNVMDAARKVAIRPAEQGYAARAIEWLAERSLAIIPG